MHYCSVCKRPFHADCGQMSRDDVALARGWTCTDCSAMSDTERKGMKRGRDDLKSKFKHIRAWHYSILDERRSFLLSKKDLLLPFCEPKKLDALICGKNGNSRASKMSIVRKSEMSLSETPNYICAELRSYQLDGVSDLLSWALRGVGGILGDEMVCFIYSTTMF